MSDFKLKKLDWQIKNTELLIDKAMIDIEEYTENQHDKIIQFEKQLEDLTKQREGKS